MVKKYRQAVSALILRPSNVCGPDGCGILYEFLLVHKPRKNDAWQLPQGGIEQGESLEEAARREVMEEAGLAAGKFIHTSDIQYTYDFPPQFVERHHPINNGQTLYFVSFLAEQGSSVSVDRREIDQHAWILPERIANYVKRDEYAEIILKVYKESLRFVS